MDLKENDIKNYFFILPDPQKEYLRCFLTKNFKTKYINEAIDNGAKLIIYEKSKTFNLKNFQNNCLFYEVKDLTKFMSKISIRFLSNDIRADALNIKVFYKKCSIQQNCKITDRSETLSAELTKKILSKAAIYEKENQSKNKKKYINKNLEN